MSYLSKTFPMMLKKRIKVLSSLDFIESGQNVILAGSPGTGMTHLAKRIKVRKNFKNGGG